MTHGRIDHHLGILEREGFVRVVEERPVRGVTERRFGPTFSRMRIDVPGASQDRLRFLFSQASREAAPDEAHLLLGVVRYESHGRARKGVATSFVAERLRAGDRLKV